jgi:hypothetical protein
MTETDKESDDDALCEHHQCRSAKAAELAAMGLTGQAVEVHTQGCKVRCRMERRPYTPPKLTYLGTVRELTAGVGSMPDGPMGQPRPGM